VLQAGTAQIHLSPDPAGDQPGRRLVTPQPGRQPLHDIPHFPGAAAGETWHCYASGQGPRRLRDGEGIATLRGVFPNALASGVLQRDVPALHEGHSECLIAAQRRPGATAPR
jgi:hypothetical protein